jgi:3-oxoadipate enol-lactonase
MRHQLGQLQRLLRSIPRGHEEPPEPPPDLPPAHLVTVPGRGEMFFRREDGPAGQTPVLLLHGWTAAADTTWWAVYPALRGRYPFVAVDHRGHGRSIRAEEPFSLEACADDAAALLHHLQIDHAIVVGYSMGGAVAMLMRQRHGDLVTSLVLAASALEWRSTLWERAIWRGMTAFEIALRLGTGDGFVQRYLRWAVEKTPEVAELRAWVAGEFKRGHPRDMVMAGRVLSEFDARSFLPAMDVPCATVVTSRDRLVRPRKQRELAAALGGRTFELDADHDAPLVHAKAFTDTMMEALRSLDP